LRGVHTGLDDLQRDLAFDRLGLFGQPHFSHAALAKLTNQAVRSDGLFEANASR
jgi:hypothetical protein